MWTVPSRVVLAADGSSSSSSYSVNSFYKDGRKVSVGECALFKPPQDSPPFIGVIRLVKTGKDKKLKLSVNWLYRPSEVKLGKGILLDAAPNELFYSFHKDEIPAASLLHPCKVAFLPKGVELPSEISSFVCRRLYDVSNKCLWWLTDKDYVNERQEEIDKLLFKTRVEMHATVQSGGRSPKPTSGPTSTSQLKSGAEVMQNSVSSFSSQVKGKKRERAEQGSEPIKRERVTKTDDGASGLSRQESLLKYEIGKIAEKGGLAGTEGVERLVQLMLQDRTEKKIDLAGRTMLAGVVAATEKYDCLSEFVQLRGLRVFDEWLQEIHKGKVGDGSGSKDTDKSVEEFLVILLRALDKLPVNLQALQMCNIGKSVNHLRSHKNSEIQKKARSLVDTWKKRVEAEMNINDMKGVSWPGRSRTEVGNRHSGGSSDVAMKSSVAQISGSKSASVKIVHGDSTTRSASVSPGSIKSAPSPASASMGVKEGHHRNTGGGTGMSDVPLTPARDEKSSSSSQSHNNSQSCSNDHARNGGVSGKDDGRSSSAGSMNVNKVSGGSSRPRKSANGFQASHSGSHREIGSSRNSSLQKNKGVEKSSQSGLTSDKVLDGANAEGNSHHNKLIVKIPNRGRSPVQNSGGYFEDPSIMSSRASSPAPSEKPDQFDRSTKEKKDAYPVTVTSEINAESWQSNDFKDALTASDEGDGSPAAGADEERCRTGDVTKKVVEVPKTALSSTGNEPKPGNPQEACIGSMHALIESCVKSSKGNASVSAVDDVGINLLASVAAGEITDSPQRNTPIEIGSAGNNLKEKLSSTENFAQNQTPCTGGMVDRLAKPDSESGNAGSKYREECLIKSGEKPVLESSALKKSSSTDSQKAEGCEEIKGSNEGVLAAAVAVVSPKTSERTTALETECKNEVIKKTVPTDEKPIASVMISKLVKGDSGDQLLSVSGRKVQEIKTEKSETVDMKFRVDKSKSPKTVPERTVPIPEIRVVTEECSGVARTSSGNMEHKMEAKETDKCLEPEKLSSSGGVQEAELVRSKASKLTVLKTDDAEESTSSGDSSSKSSIGVLGADAKVGFDLNEGFNADDGKYSEPKNPLPGCSPVGSLISPLPFPVSSVPSGLPASITITTAAAKGPFLPSKGEVGWKGSAATSAFRPAEPRKAQDMSFLATNITQPEPSTGKKRPLFDFDLNVPDERVLEDMASRYSGHETSPQLRGRSTSATQARSSGGLDLDLNEVDEAAETGNFATNNASALQLKSLATGSRMDFDLNDGPIVDDTSTDPALFGHQIRSSVSSRIPASGLRLNNAEMSNFSSWFHPGPAFPAVSVQQQQPLSIITAGGPQRMMGGPTIPGNPFASPPEAYRGGGPILSASPAMPFPSTSFQYPVFSYGTSFSMPPTTTTFPGGPAATTTTTYMDSSGASGRLSFPAVHPQLMGPTGGVSSNYPRPYLISLQDGGEGSRKWVGRQGLDLNVGPGAPEIEVVRGEESSGGLVPKQVSMSGFQALADEQAARMFQFAGGLLKRKEPEGGRDSYSNTNKQSSWH